MFIDYVKNLSKYKDYKRSRGSKLYKKNLTESSIDVLRSYYKIKTMVPGSDYIDIYFFDTVKSEILNKVLTNETYKYNKEKNFIRIYNK